MKETLEETESTTHFSDKLSEYIARIEKAEEERFHGEPIKGIITSEDLQINPDPLTRGKIVRHQIGWRVYQHTMFYIVMVAPETFIAEHHHNEDIFRYLAKGDFEINGHVVKEGMWVAVTAGTPYSITAGKNGYTAFVGYMHICATPR